MRRARPSAVALRSRRACRVRRLRALGLTVAGLLGLSCASAQPRPNELFEVCQETLRRGVFHWASLACFPEVASTLEDLMCATTFGTHRQLNALGFGYGTSVLGQALGENYSVDPARAKRWRQENCAGSPARSVLEAVELRDRAFSLLPASLVGPWQSCRDYFQVRPTTRLRCGLSGSFDLSGENETVQFEASHSPISSMDFGTWIKQDLEVQGVDCDERWRAGTWLGSRRRLRCRRQGRSAVTFRLVTGSGQCERRLPELIEPPWQAACPSIRKAASSLPSTSDGC